jgi:hypothetical protein
MTHPNRRVAALTAVAAVALSLLLAPIAHAQRSKIVCWKDAAGKVIGCGDKLPPEYQSSATKELDARGVTRKQTESVEEANQRRLREEEAARVRAEEEKKSLGQKRQDTALLETYSNEKEIDLKRDRDLQVIDLQIEQLTVALKNTTQRYNEAKGRADTADKNKKPITAAAREELARLANEKERFEQNIAAKNKEKDELRARYAEYRRRFAELKAQQQVAASPKK